jgi:hypothetical protein
MENMHGVNWCHKQLYISRARCQKVDCQCSLTQYEGSESCSIIAGKGSTLPCARTKYNYSIDYTSPIIRAG